MADQVSTTKPAQPKKERRFPTPLFVIALAVLLIAAVGVIIWQTLKINDLNDQAPTSQTYTKTETVEKGRTISIPSFAMQYEDSEKFDDLLWVVDSNGFLLLNSKTLVQKQLQAAGQSESFENRNECSMADAPIGIITKVNKASISEDPMLDAATLEQQVKEGKAQDLGNHYLIYNSPQAVCSSYPSVMNDNDFLNPFPAYQVRYDFLKALKPAQ